MGLVSNLGFTPIPSGYNGINESCFRCHHFNSLPNVQSTTQEILT